MNILSLDGIHKSFGMKPLLREVSFALEDNEKMGLIGANGSGKTTLMRIIAGQETADGGSLIVGKGQRVAFLSQNPEFDPNLTVLDAVFDKGDPALRLLHDFEEASLALNVSDGSDEALLNTVSELSHQLDVTGGWDREAGAKAILDRLGLLDTAALVGTLSGGQRKRLALAQALLLQPDLLLLDEPTNHLDTSTIAWLEKYLSRFKGALVLITHDRYFLDRVTNRMLEVDSRGTTKYEGNYTRYLELKAEQDLIEEATERTRQNLARRELAWLRRGAKARTSKAKYRVKRAQELQEDHGPGAEEKIELSAASTRLGKKVIEFERIFKAYGDLSLVTNFSKILSPKDRIGIIGENGTGKTTLLEMIVGKVQADSGSIEIGSTAVIGYFDQETRPMDESKRVIDTVTDIAEHVRTADGSTISASRMLEKFLFAPAVQYTPVAKLSGGEKRRLHLLLILMGAPNILLLDEPTNDLDIPTLTALEEYLDSFQGVLIAVSHDRWFLDRTIKAIWSFEGQGEIRSYPGDYSSYLEKKSKEKVLESAPNKKKDLPTTSAEVKPNTYSAAKFSFKEKRELEGLESIIENAEERREELEALLANSSQSFENTTKFYNELGDLTTQLEKSVERWAELAERL